MTVGYVGVATDESYRPVHFALTAQASVSTSSGAFLFLESMEF